MPVDCIRCIHINANLLNALDVKTKLFQLSSDIAYTVIVLFVEKDKIAHDTVRNCTVIDHMRNIIQITSSNKPTNVAAPFVKKR